MVTTDQSTTHRLAPVGWADPVADLPQPSLVRRWLPLVLWLGCLAVATALLLALGGGRLAAPELSRPDTWSAWAAGRDPLETTMVVLRLLALGTAWYLVGVTTISVLARVLRAARLVRLADALSVGPIRTLAQQALGIGLAAGVLATSVPAAPADGHRVAQDGPADAAVMVALDAESEATPMEVARSDAPVARAPVPAPLTMEALPDDAATTPTAAVDVPRPEGDAVGARREVRVAAGDHFWGLAEDAVAEHLGRAGTEAEVHAVWQATVTANRDRLVAAGNPDLLVPGQLVVIADPAEVLA